MINERVGRINFAGTRVDLSEGSIDAHKSGQNSILIVVTGEFTLPGNPPRLFTQTFFLAGQGTSFYCCNSVLRLLPTPTRPPAPVHVAPVVAAPVHVPAPPAPQPVVQASQPIPPSAPIQQPQQQAAPVHQAPPSQPQQVQQHATEHDEQHIQKSMQATLNALEDEDDNQQQEEEEEEPVEPVIEEPIDTGPKSYLDMLKKGTKSTVPAPAPVAAKSKSKPVASAAAPTNHAVTKAPGTTGGDDKKKTDNHHNNGAHTSPSTGAIKPKTSSGSDRPRPPSLYINKLPLDATEDELKHLFTKFGDVAIRRVDVAVGKGYAFVDLDGEESLKTILADVAATGPYSIKGTEISVEERKQSNKKNQSSGGRGGGGGGDRHRSSGGGGTSSGGERGPRRERTNNTGGSGGDSRPATSGGPSKGGSAGTGSGNRPPRTGPAAGGEHKPVKTTSA